MTGPAAPRCLRQALGLWRGPALSDVADAPFAAAPITRLSELRLAAAEDLFDAELAAGRGGELVPELEELAGAHPLRERLRGQLMRALYAAGRQADALGAYEDTRQVLAEQLGIDPSPGLAAVHLAILRGDPSLAGPGRGGGLARTAARAGPRPARAGPAGRVPDDQPAGPADQLRRPGGGAAAAGQAAGRIPAGDADRAGRGREDAAVGRDGRPAGDELPDGIWFVPLAPVRDALDVPQAVLTALGLNDTSWAAIPWRRPRLAAQQAARPAGRRAGRRGS